MRIRKHLSYGVLLLAALVLSISTANRILFARADSFIRGVLPEESNIPASTPTNTRIRSAVEFEEVTPTHIARSFYTEETLCDAEIYVATPTHTRSYSDMEYGVMSSVDFDENVENNQSYTDEILYPSAEPEEIVDIPESQAIGTEYISRVPVSIPVFTNVIGEKDMTGFVYTVEYVSGGTTEAIPELPDDTSVVMLGGEIATFQEIYFSKPGQYFFKVEQSRANNTLNTDKGYTWNNLWYFVCVTVTEGVAGLESSITCYQVSAGNTCSPCESLVTFTQVRA